MTDVTWLAGAVILGCWLIAFAVERGSDRIADRLAELSNVADEQRAALYEINAALRAHLDYRDKN